MYDTEALAIRVVHSTRNMMRFCRIDHVEDKLITNLAISGAIREAGNIFRNQNNVNSAMEELIGRPETESNISLTFSEIAEILCKDDILNRAIDILKIMSQNNWRSYQHILRDQQQNLPRENFIQRSQQ